MAQNGLLDFLQGASNSAASTVSAPVDGLAWLLRKAGAKVGDNPIGGSDWMRANGLTQEPSNKLMGLLGEAAGGVAPMVAGAYAPQIAKGLLGMADNAMAPRTLNKQAGKVFAYPQDAALATAQRNAALPVEQGGLGLHPQNTPMERAQAMGMEDAFHGTNKEFDAFDPSKTKFVKGVFASKNPSGASQYVETNPGLPTKEDGGFVMPLMADIRNQVTPDYFNMTNIRNGLNGGKAVIGGDVVVMPDASKIRSRFAAFDPMRRDSPDLLAGALPLGVMADEDSRNKLRGLLGK